MARDWINRNNNAGNVLKTQGITVDALDAIGTYEGTPNGNIVVFNVINLGAGASTVTADGSKSLIGDQLLLLIEANGAATITLGGDLAAGTITLTGAGVAAVQLIFNGTSFFATVTPE